MEQDAEGRWRGTSLQAFDTPRQPLVDASIQLDVVADLFFDREHNTTLNAAIPTDENSFSWYQALQDEFPTTEGFLRHLVSVYLDPDASLPARKLAMDFLELTQGLTENKANMFDVLLTKTALFTADFFYNHSQPLAMSESGFWHMTEALFVCLPQYIDREPSVLFFRKILLYLARCPYKAKILKELTAMQQRRGSTFLRAILRKAPGSESLAETLTLILPELIRHYPEEYSFGLDEEFEALYTAFSAYFLRCEVCSVLSDMCSYSSLWAVDQRTPNPEAAYGSYPMDSIIALACGLAATAKSYIVSRSEVCPLLLFAPFKENRLFRQFFGLDCPALDSPVGMRLTLSQAQGYFEILRACLQGSGPDACIHDVEPDMAVRAAVAMNDNVVKQTVLMFSRSKRCPVGEILSTVYSYPFMLLMNTLSTSLGQPVTESIMTNETLLFGLAAASINLAYASSLGRASDCDNEIRMMQSQIEADTRKGAKPDPVLPVRIQKLEEFSKHARARIGQKSISKAVQPFLKSFFGLLAAFSKFQASGDYVFQTLTVDIDSLILLSPLTDNLPTDLEQPLPSSYVKRDSITLHQSEPEVPPLLWFLPATMLYAVPHIVDSLGIVPFIERRNSQRVDPGYWMIVEYFNAALYGTTVSMRQMSTRLCIEALTSLLGIHSFVNDPVFEGIEKCFTRSMLNGLQTLPLGAGFSQVFSDAPMPVLQRSLAALMRYFASDMKVYPLSMLFPHTVFHQGLCHAYNVAMDMEPSVFYPAEGSTASSPLSSESGFGGQRKGVFVWTAETLSEVPFMEAFVLAIAGDNEGWRSIGGQSWARNPANSGHSGGSDESHEEHVARLRTRLEKAFGKIFSSPEELRRLSPSARLPDNASLYFASLIAVISSALVETNKFLTNYQAYLSGKALEPPEPGPDGQPSHLDYSDHRAVVRQLSQLLFYSYMCAIPCVLCAVCPQILLFDTNLNSILTNMITIIGLMHIFRVPTLPWTRGSDILQVSCKKLGERWSSFLFLISQGINNFAHFMGGNYSTELADIIYGAMPLHFTEALEGFIQEGLVELDPGFLQLIRSCGLSTDDIAARLEGKEREQFEEDVDRYSCQLMSTLLKDPLVLHEYDGEMYIVDRASIADYLKTTGKNPLTQEEIKVSDLRPPPESWMQGFRAFKQRLYDLRKRFSKPSE